MFVKQSIKNISSKFIRKCVIGLLILVVLLGFVFFSLKFLFKTQLHPQSVAGLSSQSVVDVLSSRFV